jgi:hypothetical protein
MLAVLAAPLARADAARGGQLARQWCANCPSSTVNPPVPFHKVRRALPQFRIAERRPTSLAYFCHTLTGAVPDLALTRAEIDDLVGYIETLR